MMTDVQVATLVEPRGGGVAKKAVAKDDYSERKARTRQRRMER